MSIYCPLKDPGSKHHNYQVWFLGPESLNGQYMDPQGVGHWGPRHLKESVAGVCRLFQLPGSQHAYGRDLDSCQIYGPRFPIQIFCQMYLNMILVIVEAACSSPGSSPFMAAVVGSFAILGVTRYSASGPLARGLHPKSSPFRVLQDTKNSPHLQLHFETSSGAFTQLSGQRVY